MTSAAPTDRSRLVTGVRLPATTAAGLASRRSPTWLPAFVERDAGDTLWAAAEFWMLAMIRPNRRTLPLGAAALGIAVTVEVSQLYHAPWIDAVRSTRIGARALGRHFPERLWRRSAGLRAGARSSLTTCVL